VRVAVNLGLVTFTTRQTRAPENLHFTGQSPARAGGPPARHLLDMSAGESKWCQSTFPHRPHFPPISPCGLSNLRHSCRPITQRQRLAINDTSRGPARCIGPCMPTSGFIEGAIPHRRPSGCGPVADPSPNPWVSLCNSLCRIRTGYRRVPSLLPSVQAQKAPHAGVRPPDHDPTPSRGDRRTSNGGAAASTAHRVLGTAIYSYRSGPR
jgi:hypothetical protein